MAPPSSHSEVEADVDDDWEVIPENWWCTSVSGSGVSWTYPHPRSERMKVKAIGGRRNGVYAKPMYYHRTLFHSSGEPVEEEVADDDDADLNPALLGVKCAVGVLKAYERDVGFHLSSSDVEHEPWMRSLHVDVVEEDLLYSQKQWHDLVQDLVQSNDTTRSPIAFSVSPSSISTPSTPSSTDLTWSERSLDSMPSTPKPKGLPFDDIIVNDRDSLSLSPESARKLNISASSFVPSPCKRPATPITNFTFPTLNRPPPPVKLQTDEAVVGNVKSNRPKSSSAPLPPVSKRAKRSRTREIVDRLKTDPGRKFDATFEFNPDADTQQDDGWIRRGVAMSLEDEKQALARRSQDSFLARRQRKTSDSESTSSGVDDDIASGPNSFPSSASSLKNNYPLHSPADSNDGWISGPPNPPNRSPNIIYNSAPKAVPVVPLVYSAFPVPVSYYPCPSGYTAAYIQMQAQMQIQMAPYPLPFSGYWQSATPPIGSNIAGSSGT